MGGEDAYPAAGKRAMGGKLPIAPAIGNIVEAHAKAVESDGKPRDSQHARRLQRLPMPADIIRHMPEQQSRRVAVGNGREDQRHPRKLEQRKQSL